MRVGYDNFAWISLGDLVKLIFLLNEYDSKKSTDVINLYLHYMQVGILICKPM